MHFVYNVHPEAASGGLVAKPFPYVPYVLNAGVGGPVDLLHIHGNPLGHLLARCAGSAGLGGGPPLTVQGLGQNSGDRGFAHSPGAAEKIGVGYALLADGVLESAGYVALPHYLLEGLRPPTTGQYHVCHGPHPRYWSICLNREGGREMDPARATASQACRAISSAQNAVGDWVRPCAGVHLPGFGSPYYPGP